MNEACLLSLADNLSSPQVKEGVSNSIIVFGNYKSQKVAFKITAKSKPHNNSLDIERDVYMYVKNVMSLETPHFASGISIGNCNVGDIMESKNPFLKTTFAQKWKILRGAGILQKLEKSRNVHEITKLWIENEEAMLNPNELTIENFCEFLYNKYSVELNKESMHYIMTEQMEGISLNKFFESNQNEIKSNRYFEHEISVQIAQALCVAQLHNFMHNDLHFGNIFIKKRKVGDKPIEYLYPFKFSLDTNYFVTIFDFDFSWYADGKQNTYLNNGMCAGYGTCSKFTENFDWYFYLYCLIEKMNYYIRQTPLQSLLGDNFQEQPDFGNKGQYVMKGRPCICTAENIDQALNTQERCIGECGIDTKTLNTIMNPCFFLRGQSTLLPQMKLNYQPKNVVTIHTPKTIFPQKVLERQGDLVNPSELLKDYKGPPDIHKQLDFLMGKTRTNRHRRRTTTTY